MYASKSLSLIKKTLGIGKTYESFKPAVDTRNMDFIVSRGIDEKLPARRVGNIAEVTKSSAEIIVLDEIQFFKNDGFEEAIIMLKNMGKTILMAGLDRIANGEYWPIYPLALKLSDEVVRLTAVCDICGGVASYTKKLYGSDAIVQIDGVDDVKFIPSCEQCFRKK
jgi:thymidine kinase